MHRDYLCVCLSIATLIINVTAYADTPQTLSFDEALQRALAQQPAVQAYQAASTAAQAQAQFAAQLPDPQLKFGIINMPITGSDSLRLNRDNMTMTTIGLMQNMVQPAKRLAATAQWHAQAQQMQANAQNTTQMIRRDVALAWLDTFAANKTAAIKQRVMDELQAQQQVLLTQLASGVATSNEVLQLQTLITQTHHQQMMAQGEARKAQSVLIRWLGELGTRPLEENLPNLTLATNDAVQIAQHPVLLAAQQEVAVRQHQSELAQAQNTPDWRWELMIGQRQSSRTDMVSLQVSVDLPWQTQQRQYHQQAAALANMTQAELLLADQRRALVAELAQAQADYDTTQAQLQAHVNQLMPATHALLATTQAGYSAGNASLSALWQARSNVLEVELAYWLLRVQRLSAMVRLSYLLSTEKV